MDANHIAHGPGEILLQGEADEPLESWTPDEFDHFTDLGLLRRDAFDAD